MITVTMIGTLTKDPELKKGGDTKVCQMRLAELNGGESPLFIDVAAFGRLAPSCAKHLAKGRHIAVGGRLRMREWEDDDGEKRRGYSIAADRIDFLPGERKRRGGQGGDSEEDDE